jgi:hypothetical protein
VPANGHLLLHEVISCSAVAQKSALFVAKALVRHVYLVYGAQEMLVNDLGGGFINEIFTNVHWAFRQPQLLVTDQVAKEGWR